MDEFRPLELGRLPVVHVYDLSPAAAARLNPPLLAAALREEAQGAGIEAGACTRSRQSST